MDIRGTVAHGSIKLTRPLAHHSEFACACLPCTESDSRCAVTITYCIDGKQKRNARILTFELLRSDASGY